MIDRARQRAAQLRFGRAFANILAFPLYVLGWVPGLVARLARLLVAIVVEGFAGGYRGPQG